MKRWAGAGVGKGPGDGWSGCGATAEAGARQFSTITSEVAVTSYNVKIRFNGAISYVTVNASSAGQAKQLVLAQYGDQVDVMSVQRA